MKTIYLISFIILALVTIFITACSVYELDLTNNVPLEKAATLEDKRLSDESSSIFKVNDIIIPYSETGIRLTLNSGIYVITISCWAGLDNEHFDIKLTMLEAHNYIAACKFKYGFENRRFWAVIIDKEENKVVGKSSAMPF